MLLGFVITAISLATFHCTVIFHCTCVMFPKLDIHLDLLKNYKGLGGPSVLGETVCITVDGPPRTAKAPWTVWGDHAQCHGQSGGTTYCMTDVHLVKDRKMLENVRKFGCKVAAHQWDASYEELLELFELQPLEQRRLHLKLGLMFKIIH